MGDFRLDGGMNPLEIQAHRHAALTRRYFLQRVGTMAAGLSVLPSWAKEAAPSPDLASLIEALDYLTPTGDFRNVERHRPLPGDGKLRCLVGRGGAGDSFQLPVAPRVPPLESATRAGSQ